MRRLLITLFWIVSVLALAILVTLPVSLQAQAIGSLAVIAAMVILRRLNPHGSLRMLPLALGSVIVLRYVYWRTTSTIPPVDELENFIPGFTLYLAEMYSVFMLALSLFVVSMPLPSRKPVLPAGVEEGDEAAWPTVDVFIPTYNEPTDLLINTMAAAKAMDYPEGRFTVWLLDDGGTEAKRASSDIAAASAAQRRHDELRRVCAEFGVRYLTRAENTHAKSGNLNNALAHSGAELVAIFDADHAPARNFLRDTVGHFSRDARLSLVQTPHFFLNPDPIEKNLQTFETMPSEAEMFYGRIQLGLDKWNGTFFCGSAAVLRRAALEDIGGFATSSITEDCETSVMMHSRKWNSVYVDTPMVAGLQPGTFASFIGQRSRWAQGMMQIMLLRRPMFRAGLTLPQRICYLSSMLFWLFPFPRLTFALAPLCYIFFDLQIFTASGGEFLAYTLAYMIVNLLMQNYLYGDVRRPWFSELYEYAQSLHLLPAVIAAMLRPKKPTFRVTAKDESVLTSRLSELSWPFFVMFGLLLVALVVTVWRFYTEPFRSDVLLVVGLWNVFNLVVAGAALGVVAERAQKTQTRRVRVSRACEFATMPAEGATEEWTEARIENVSVTGAQIRLSPKAGFALRQGAIGEIRFAAHDPRLVGALPVAVRNVDVAPDMIVVGCQYAPETPDHHRMVADLIFANSEQWTEFQARRRKNVGIIMGTIGFLVMATRETVRGCAYVLKLAFSGDKEAKTSASAAPAKGVA